MPANARFFLAYLLAVVVAVGIAAFRPHAGDGPAAVLLFLVSNVPSSAVLLFPVLLCAVALRRRAHVGVLPFAALSAVIAGVVSAAAGLIVSLQPSLMGLFSMLAGPSTGLVSMAAAGLTGGLVLGSGDTAPARLGIRGRRPGASLAFVIAMLASVVTAGAVAAAAFTATMGPERAAEGFGWSLIFLLFYLPVGAVLLFVVLMLLSLLRFAAGISTAVLGLIGAGAGAGSAGLILMALLAMTGAQDPSGSPMIGLCMASMGVAGLVGGLVLGLAPSGRGPTVEAPPQAV